MEGGDGVGPSFVWEVGPDLIDHERWAEVAVALDVEAKRGELSPFVRFGFWPIVALVVVIIGATRSVLLAVFVAVVIPLVFVAVRLVNRNTARRLAAKLRSVPAAAEPFRFVADARGTRGDALSSSETMSWSRYRSVRIHDELVAFTRDSDAILVLPIAGLTSGQPIDVAVDTMRGWIEAAQPGGWAG